ncbi:MAG: hypothetical protein ACI8ZM_000004 [Crocinitomix sp.]|jgi:hypothetical protein
MSTTEKLIDDWYQRVRVTQLAHYASADHFGKRKYSLGIPAVVLSAIVGTTAFATLQSKPDFWLQIIVGLASVTAALLTSLQTLLGYSERAEKHRIAGAKYGSVGRELEFLKTQSNIENDLILNLKKRLDDLAEESPNNSNKIYYRAGAAKLE